MKLEIDDLERRAIERSLAERRSHLIEKAGDTTLTPARRQASYRELSAIASALPEFRREVQPPASLNGLDVPSRRAVFVKWKTEQKAEIGRASCRERVSSPV